MILDKIAAKKREKIAMDKEKISFKEMKKLALEKMNLKDETEKEKEKELILKEIKSSSREKGEIFLIGEVKLASPSKGDFQVNMDIEEIAAEYEKGGANCISVLTEEDYFKGSREIFEKVRETTPLPLLRKDFILEEYQLYESRVMGAELVLLIAGLLDDKEKLKRFMELAGELGILPLVEVHNRDELDLALDGGAELIGINNRDLKKFETSLKITRNLLPAVPIEKAVISESGIHGPEDILGLKKMGDGKRKVDGVLVGEALVTEDNPAKKIMELKKGAG